MTIRIFLEQYNGHGQAIEGEPSPGLWLELDSDGNGLVTLGADLDRHEYRDAERALESDVVARTLAATVERLRLLTEAITEHRAAAHKATTDHNERIRRFTEGSKNHLRSMHDLDVLRYQQSRALWDVLSADDVAVVNSYRSSARRDFTRSLTVTSAVRAIGMVWRDAELDRLAPDTLERAARLLHAGAGGARTLAERLDRRATYMRDHHPATKDPAP